MPTRSTCCRCSGASSPMTKPATAISPSRFASTRIRRGCSRSCRPQAWKAADTTTSPAASSPCIAAIATDSPTMLVLIENVLNRGLPRSPRARELCRELAGARLGIEVRGLTRILVSSSGEVLHCAHDPSGSADADVSGGALSLLQLAGSAAENVARSGAVEIRGDAQIARKFRELAKLLMPDP